MSRLSLEVKLLWLVYIISWARSSSLASPQATQVNFCCYNYNHIRKLVTKATEWIFSVSQSIMLFWEYGLEPCQGLRTLERDCVWLVTLCSADCWIFNSWGKEEPLHVQLLLSLDSFCHVLTFCAVWGFRVICGYVLMWSVE